MKPSLERDDSVISIAHLSHFRHRQKIVYEDFVGFLDLECELENMILLSCEKVLESVV